MRLAVGTRLGAYEILAAIGAGGMGEVYQARDTTLGRDVAIKIVLQGLAADPESLGRLQREAQALAALNHPHIATLHGFEERSGQHFLVMEFVAGRTLAEIIDGRSLPVPEALKIARQITEALEAAHEHGIVHRDLKPANIKITPDDRVKVLDFGLAKALGTDRGTSSGDAMNSPTFTARATEIGIILGTAGYMAPEQARGRPLDRRADVWAFGVVLFEMLTGRRAFQGDTVTDVLASVVKDAPPTEALPPDTPVAIRRLLRRCLEKDRARRLDSMAGARLEIDDALGTVPDAEVQAAPTVPVTRRRTPAVALVLAGALLGAALAGASVWMATRPAPPSVSKLSITSPAVPISLETNHPDLVLTPDGSRVVYWNEVKNDRHFVVRSLDTFDGRVLTNLGPNPRGPFLSPEGTWLGFYYGATSGVGASIGKVPIDGGAPIKIADVDANLRGASWGADGTIVFATIRPTTGLQRVPAAGGTPEVLTTPATADNERDHRWPFLLPDGRHVLFEIARAGGPDVSDIGLLSLDTRKWSVLIRGGTFPRYVKTGHILYGSAGALRAIAFDLDTLTTRGDPVQIVNGLVIKESGAADFSTSDNGTLVYVPGRSTTMATSLAWVDRTGKVVPMAVEPRQYRSVTLSPDGRQAAFSIEEQGNAAIWIYDFARESLTRITPDTGFVSMWPLWSPDGREIAFWAASLSGSNDGGVFRTAASGTGAPRRLTRSTLRQLPTSWTPDGKGIVLETVAGAGTDIELLTLAPEPKIAPLIVAPGFDQSAVVSPDGKWLAYNSDASGRDEVFLRPFPNADADRVPVSTTGGGGPFWSKTGKELYYSDLEGNLQLVALSLDPGGRAVVSRPKKVIDAVASAAPRGFRMAPDGQRFLFISLPGTDPLNEIRVVLNWRDEMKADLTGRR
jgi:eukaryotic-like serine/threonine-protein kinase